MIVVEGPDGAGKTTLIEWITDVFGLTPQPRVVGSDTKAMVDLQKWVEDHNSIGWAEPLPHLYDRHRLISEFIYGPIIGRKPEPGFDNLGWVATELNRFYAQQPLLIYCLPPIDVVRRNTHRPDTDNSAVADRIDSIWVAYSRLVATDCLFHDALLWDYTETSYDWLYVRIRHVLSIRGYDLGSRLRSPARPTDRRLWG